MQSQQKRVKWSRGETAEALEERTDTGITQASVEFMENCIPDIYGNVSRRPGLSLLPLADTYDTTYATASLLGFTYDTGLQFAVFYITENDIVLCGIHTHAQPEFIRIKDGVILSKFIASDTACWNGIADGGEWKPQVISYAQQNNYLVVATATNVWKIRFETSETTFGANIDLWKFSAGWYATEGTKTRSVSYGEVPSLNFTGDFTSAPYTDLAGITTLYSWISTSVAYTNLDTLKSMIPVGSIVQMPNKGCYFRIEGYTASGGATMVLENYTFDGVLGVNDSVPATGTYCKQRIESYTAIVAHHHGSGSTSYVTFEEVTKYRGCLDVYVNGSQLLAATFKTESTTMLGVKNTASSSGVSVCQWNGSSDWATITIMGQTGKWVPAYNTTIYAYGALLTPVADDSASDNNVSVEYGYTSLEPESFEIMANYPHPKKVAFHNQRLWAGDWAYSNIEEYALVIGSQIARYNDLKNDYNMENEPITLDILTQFKERIIHLVDYNGLKIFTDSYEYAYENGGVVKQSSNGAYENCPPLVFESLCLYVDGTGHQVKAMQYEFQSNIFNSSSINTLAPHDLVWFPYSMAAYEDRIHSTGKYLFLINKNATNIPRIAVCNFVPGNQANIWNRWKTQNVTLNDGSVVPLVDDAIHTKAQPIFMVNLYQVNSNNDTLPSIIYPAVLDFSANTDITCTPTGTKAALVSYTKNSVTYSLITPSADVAVYANGVFQFMDTLTSAGALTKDISGLANVTVGMPINAKIVSHPIDVGGKTKSIKKRIGKAQMSVYNTDAGAVTINGKTGYMNPAKDHICFYGVTGMKNEIKYTITNNNGAMFHLESLLMNIEYGTLIS